MLLLTETFWSEWWRRSGAANLCCLLLLLLASLSVTTFNISVFDLRPAGKYWQSGAEWKTLHFCSGASEMSFPLRLEEVLCGGGVHWRRRGWRMAARGLPSRSHFFHLLPLSTSIPPTAAASAQLVWTVSSSSTNLSNHFVFIHFLSWFKHDSASLQFQPWLNHEIQECGVFFPQRRAH